MSVELAQDGELLLGDLSLYRSVSWRVMRERFWRKVRVGGWLELRRLFTYRFHAARSAPLAGGRRPTTAVPPCAGAWSSMAIQARPRSDLAPVPESQTAVTWRAVLAGDAAGAPWIPGSGSSRRRLGAAFGRRWNACEAYYGFLRAPDRIAPDGLRRFEEAIASANIGLRLRDEVDETGPEAARPHLQADWAPEHFRSCMYTGRLTVSPPTAALAAGPFDPNHGDAHSTICCCG